MKNTENLFVASMLYDYAELVEPFVQYETFGKIDHHVIFTPEKRLVYRVEDENGVTKYYDYKTKKEISLYDKRASYSTRAGALSTLTLTDPRTTGIIPPHSILEMIEHYRENANLNGIRYGFLVPVDDFIKVRFGNLPNISPAAFNILLHIISTNKVTELSFNEEEAEEQISSLMYGLSLEKKEKRKK